MIMIDCLECGAQFEKNRKKQYCSKSCASKSYRKRKKKILKNPELAREKRKKKRVADKAQVVKAEYNRCAGKVSKKKKDIEFLLNIEEFETLIFDNCYYCGDGPSIPTSSGFLKRNTIDRINSDLDYIYHNCVTCCYRCNVMKSDMTQDEFFSKVCKIEKFIKTYIGKNASEFTLRDRVQMYNNTFPNYPKMIFDAGWIVGNWSIGSCYKGSGYYGAYPYKYLTRIRSMFNEFGKEEVLHLFSGSLSKGFSDVHDWSEEFPGITFDCNADLGPDICGDAHNLSEYFDDQFSIILADAPYSGEDANKYGTPLVNRNKVVKQCHGVLKQGGFLLWLDMAIPMYSKKDFKRIGHINIAVSTNHRVRALTIFQKV